jgi:hypothetical protein
MAISTVRKGRDEARRGATPEDVVTVRRNAALAALGSRRNPAETQPCRLFQGSLDWLAGFASGRPAQNRPTGKHSSFSSVAQRQSIRLLTGGL